MSNELTTEEREKNVLRGRILNELGLYGTKNYTKEQLEQIIKILEG
jgi:hypothetical protein